MGVSSCEHGQCQAESRQCQVENGQSLGSTAPGFPCSRTPPVKNAFFFFFLFFLSVSCMAQH